MWTGLLTGIVMPVILLASVRYGLPGIGWAWVLIFPFVDSPSMFIAFRRINVSLMQWLDSLKPAGVSCIVMTVAVLGIRGLLPDHVSAIVRTVVSIATGVVVYQAVLWFGFGDRLRVMIELAKKIRTSPAA